MINTIIIRAAGERTEKACIRKAEKEGNVFVIRVEPFGAAIMETYLKALDVGAKYTTVIDADVLIYPGIIDKAIRKLETKNKNIFCLDGKTDDKIMMKPRRAGFHIYRTEFLSIALDFIDFEALKPESNVRNEMAKIGFPTWSGAGLVFGQHDFEQFYCDLWRKAICQAWKLENMIDKTNIISHWKDKARHDNDFKVILAANEYGKKNTCSNEIIIDKRINFDAKKNIKNLGLEEKGNFNESF